MTRVRRAVGDDLGVVLALTDALIREDAGRHDPDANLAWAAGFGRDHLHALLGDDSRVALLAPSQAKPEAETDGEAHAETHRPAGAASGLLLGSLVKPSPFQPLTVARIGALYVRPEDRGRRVGTALVTAFLDWAESRDVRVAQVTAYAANTRAIAFYQRQGLMPYELVLRRRP